MPYFTATTASNLRSLQILDYVKEAYFKRLYPRELYKIVSLNNRLREDLSPDIENLRNLINSSIGSKVNKKKQGKSKSKSEVKNDLVVSNYEKMGKKELINKLTHSNTYNKFLKIPALLLEKEERLIPILEYNNSTTEEALLFVFYRRRYVYVLWENSNPNRAAYLFKYFKRNQDIALKTIAGVIRKKEYGKRDKLYRKEGDSFFVLECKSYESLKHQVVETYEQKLKRLLSGNK